LGELHSVGLDCVSLSHGDWEEHHMTFHPLPGEDVSAFFARVARSLKERNALVLKHDVLGPLEYREKALHTLWSESEKAWPVTWVEGAPCDGSLLSGSQIWAVSGLTPEDLYDEGGVPRGRLLKVDNETLCLLGDMTGSSGSSPPQQTAEVLEGIKNLLAQVGIGLDCLLRTWFYLHGILEWYSAFNDSRTLFFERNGIDLKRPPASTGVGGRCPEGSALTAGAIAIQKKDPSDSFEAILSSAQCAATDYGSSFSRATETFWGGHRRLFVSGTASIAPNGETEHVGNVKAQMERTLHVVCALLKARGMSLENVTRAVAYLKRPSDAPELFSHQRDGKLSKIPLVVTHNAICREDLLFELELDAVQCPPQKGE